MPSTNWNGYVPLPVPLVQTGQHQGTTHGAYLPVAFILPAFAQREGHDQNAVIPMRVKSPIYLLRGQFGATTETWIGSNPSTPPPSGHALTERSHIVLDC